MRKITAFSLLCLLAFGAASCSDGNDGPVTPSNTITVGNETHPVLSSFRAYEAADEFDEGGHMILLFKEAHTTVPSLATGFYVGIAISDSYLGKEIDLTKKLAKNGSLAPFVSVISPERMIEIDDMDIEVYPQPDDDFALDDTVKEGKLLVTRDGMDFRIKLSVELSDGYSFGADWSGVPVEAFIE